MNMPETMHGFRLVRSRSIGEIQAVLHEMTHEKSGARLAWLDREDENKTFGIAFRTTPEDDTGVFHILEHSVLCGSDRYPVKEPFVELMKSSLNTFLNAMTYPDKTVYPICTRNNADYVNLLRIYMDAVLHPAISHKEEIFCQEGWHYEFSEDGTPSYKGVVFNEMKGALASGEDRMDSALWQGLFPDTAYRFESGGDPEAIPTLTYGEFLRQHERFYHPANSYIFLDGSVDIDTVLGILDGEFLSHYTAIAPAPLPEVQKAVNGGVLEREYEQSPEEPIEGRTLYGMGVCIGTYDDRKKLVAAQALTDAVCGTNQSPLCRALLDRELAEDVSLSITDGVLQPVMLLEAENIRDEDLNEVKRVLRETVDGLCTHIDPDLLTASLASLEFQMRERDYGRMPRGLVYCLSMLDTWLYDGDPAKNLELGTLFRELRADMEQGYFEKLLRELLVDNPHRCEIICRPSHTAGDRAREAEAKRLEKALSGLSDREMEALREKQKAIAIWQETEDSPEAAATIPMLALSEVSVQPERIPREITRENGVESISHAISTGGIVYENLYFDLGEISGEDISALSFLCLLLGKLEAGQYSSMELQNRVRLLTGELSFAVAAFAPVTGGACRALVQVTVSALEHNLAQALELVGVILTKTRLGDRAAIKEILLQRKTGMLTSFQTRGVAAALGRVSAGMSREGMVGEYAGGLEFYQWVKGYADSFDARFDALRETLCRLMGEIFVSGRMTVSVTGTMADGVKKTVELLANALPAGTAVSGEPAVTPWGVCREGIVIPADIAFAARGGAIAPFGGSYNGTIQVAGQILSLGYLWNVIRVQGGAYGTGFAARTNGMAACWSYRDPDGVGSLEKFCGGAEFLRQFCASEPDLTGYILGTIGEVSPLLTPRMQGLTGDVHWLRGMTDEWRLGFRKEILEAGIDGILAQADMLEKAIPQGGSCILASQAQISRCEGLDKITTL